MLLLRTETLLCNYFTVAESAKVAVCAKQTLAAVDCHPAGGALIAA